ncbi:MAG: PE family protein, partial [Mycobacterium sp.]|nr:PE family protein [Mycobacterium sp.]
MSFLNVVPEELTSAAADLSSIGSYISNANLAAAGATTSLLGPGGDEVSTAVASLFSEHGQVFQGLVNEAQAFQQQFVSLLTVGSGGYLSAEAANVSPLQSLESVFAAGSSLQTLDSVLADAPQSTLLSVEN